MNVWLVGSNEPMDSFHLDTHGCLPAGRAVAAIPLIDQPGPADLDGSSVSR